jgi:hypothetical protein
MPFVKGKSGNYKGRPKKGETLTDLLVKYGSMKAGEGRERYRDKIVAGLYELALEKGKDYASVRLAAIKYIFDRIDGKPVETSRVEVNGGDIPVVMVTEKGLFDELEEEERGGAVNGQEGVMDAAEETGGCVVEYGV